METHGAVGAIVANMPLVCVNKYVGQACYQLKNPQGKWTKIDIETLGGHHSTSTITAEGSLWIMGSWPGAKSTEILTFDNNGKFVSQTSGPDLPQKAWGICSFGQRDSKVMIAGGSLGTSTYIYSFDEDKWVEGPALQHGRRLPGCGTIIDHTTFKL